MLTVESPRAQSPWRAWWSGARFHVLIQPLPNLRQRILEMRIHAPSVMGGVAAAICTMLGAVGSRVIAGSENAQSQVAQRFIVQDNEGNVRAILGRISEDPNVDAWGLMLSSGASNSPLVVVRESDITFYSREHTPRLRVGLDLFSQTAEIIAYAANPVDVANSFSSKNECVRLDVSEDLGPVLTMGRTDGVQAVMTRDGLTIGSQGQVRASIGLVQGIAGNDSWGMAIGDNLLVNGAGVHFLDGANGPEGLRGSIEMGAEGMEIWSNDRAGVQRFRLGPARGVSGSRLELREADGRSVFLDNSGLVIGQKSTEVADWLAAPVRLSVHDGSALFTLLTSDGAGGLVGRTLCGCGRGR